MPILGFGRSTDPKVRGVGVRVAAVRPVIVSSLIGLAALCVAATACTKSPDATTTRNAGGSSLLTAPTAAAQTATSSLTGGVTPTAVTTQLAVVEPTSVAPRVGSIAVAPMSKQLVSVVSRLATASDGAIVYGAGGLSASRASSDRIISVNAATGASAVVGTLPRGVHDAAGVWAAGRLVVLGGGADSAEDLIQTWVPGAAAEISGHLPEARADLGAVADGDTIYVVGGAHGTTMNLDILAIDAHTLTTTVVGSLPHGNRYGSVAVLDHMVYLFGGELIDGVPLNEVWKIDPTTGSVTPLAPLPSAVSHAGAVSLRSTVLLIGGRHSAVFTNEIVSWTPTGGATVLEPSLPAAVSDPGVAVVGDTVVVVGGERDHESVRDIEAIQVMS